MFLNASILRLHNNNAFRLAIAAQNRFVSTVKSIESIRNVDFQNCEGVFSSKSTSELLRAYAVFHLCSKQFLVKRNDQIFRQLKSFLGDSLFQKLLKSTVYGHFVGGEDEESLKPLIERLRQANIGAILDYAVEADVSTSDAVKAEMSSHGGSTSYSGDNVDVTDVRFKPSEKFGDRRKGVHSARTYFYDDEIQCDKNVEIFKKCIEVAGACSENGFAAMKITALGRPQFLLQLSALLIQVREYYDAMSGVFPHDVMRRRVDKDHFTQHLQGLGVPVSRDDVGEWFTWLDTQKDGSIDLLEWSQLLNPDNKFSHLFVVPCKETGQLQPLFNPLSTEEEAQMKNLIERLDTLARAAQKANVSLMIDAEQTYFQPAISRLTMELMRVYNKSSPVIYNTYQCYLREAYNNFTMDIELAKREGFHFGAKVVRGAYMDPERERSRSLGYNDPINDDFASTTRMYERVVGEALNQIHKGHQVSIIAATHNEDSVKFTCERCKQLGIDPSSNQVHFAQLLGMRDHVSYTLGRLGYSVFKYIPFGPVGETIPYLSRRAVENHGMLQNVDKEKHHITSELKQRIFRK